MAGRGMVVGITGGIGSGKSLVSAEFKRLGAVVIDADVVAREVVEKGAPGHEEILKAFGPGFFDKDGALNRKALAAVVFKDPEKLARLNAVIHPRIRERIRQKMREYAKTRALVVVDAPLLFENGLDKEMDKTVVVYAYEEERVGRVVKREGVSVSRERVKEIMAAQMPLEDKIKKADFVIDNNGPLEETIAAVRALFRKLAKAKA